MKRFDVTAYFMKNIFSPVWYMYQKIPLELSIAQYRKLKSGQPIQLSHAQLMAERHWVAVHPETYRKIQYARSKKKGTRIVMTPHEMEASGEGLKEFWEGVKSLGRKVKEKVIDTPFYQQNIKPLVRQAVDAGLAVASPTLGPLSGVARSGVDALGKSTGAYGLAVRKRKGNPRVTGNQTEWPEPVYNAVTFGTGTRRRSRGGSFRPA